jgi:ATP-dependent Clp protease adaptor protein ClpS
MQIKLAVPVVLPLIEVIRRQADLLEATDQMLSQDEVVRQRINWLEVRRLLALVSYPDFPNSGLVRIGHSDAPTVLRACSYFRLQFRKSALSAIPDATLETGLDPNLYTGEEHRAVMCYLFLTTLQETVLKNLPALALFSPRTLRMWRALSSAVGGFLSKRNKPADGTNSFTANEVWQVVVQNDPVNLMSYVTAVFKSVLGLPEEVATQRMREVHELKSSKVWEGSKDQAEIYVRSLQSWHLQAILRRK